jgi:hypothetical protein
MYSILRPRSFIHANIALLPTRDGVAHGKFLLDLSQQWNARVKNFQELNILIERFTCSLTSSEAFSMLSPMIITLCNIYISICNIRQDKNRGLLRIVSWPVYGDSGCCLELVTVQFSLVRRNCGPVDDWAFLYRLFGESPSKNGDATPFFTHPAGVA